MRQPNSPSHPPDDELGLKRDRLSLVDPVWPVPLPADELAAPASERVGSEQAGETLVNRTEPLQDGEHEPLLALRFRMGHLAAQHSELLAQHEQLEVLRARRPADEEQEA